MASHSLHAATIKGIEVSYVYYPAVPPRSGPQEESEGPATVEIVTIIAGDTDIADFVDEIGGIEGVEECVLSIHHKHSH